MVKFQLLRMCRRTGRVHGLPCKVNNRCFSSKKPPDPGALRRKLIKMEYEVLRQSDPSIPECLSPEQLQQLYNIPEASVRLQYLRTVVTVDDISNDPLPDRVSASPFDCIDDAALSRYRHPRLCSALIHGQPLVVDMGYDTAMSPWQKEDISRQLLELYAANCDHREPFNLYFCNVEKNCHSMHKLKQHYPELLLKDYPVNMTHRSYLDLFPKEHLVYLSPYGSRNLIGWYPESVFVLGGVSSQQPLSLAKAKKEGVKVLSLPLDFYIQ